MYKSCFSLLITNVTVLYYQLRHTSYIKYKVGSMMDFVLCKEIDAAKSITKCLRQSFEHIRSSFLRIFVLQWRLSLYILAQFWYCVLLCCLHNVQALSQYIFCSGKCRCKYWRHHDHPLCIIRTIDTISLNHNPWKVFIPFALYKIAPTDKFLLLLLLESED